MKKVNQEFHKNRPDYNDKMIGDCWRACIASVFELKLEEVPHFAELWNGYGKRTACTKYWRFLIKHNYIPYAYELDKPTKPEKVEYPVILNEDLEYYFAVGESPRGVDHMVIYKDGVMVHDPHPDNNGLVNIKYWEILVEIDDKSGVSDVDSS